jgi:hypothetical protein
MTGVRHRPPGTRRRCLAHRGGATAVCRIISRQRGPCRAGHVKRAKSGGASLSTARPRSDSAWTGSPVLQVDGESTCNRRTHSSTRRPSPSKGKIFGGPRRRGGRSAAERPSAEWTATIAPWPPLAPTRMIIRA